VRFFFTENAEKSLSSIEFDGGFNLKGAEFQDTGSTFIKLIEVHVI
jgi:hypothetical protein